MDRWWMDGILHPVPVSLKLLYLDHVSLDYSSPNPCTCIISSFKKHLSMEYLLPNQCACGSYSTSSHICAAFSSQPMCLCWIFSEYICQWKIFHPAQYSRCVCGPSLIISLCLGTVFTPHVCKASSIKSVCCQNISWPAYVYWASSTQFTFCGPYSTTSFQLPKFHPKKLPLMMAQPSSAPSLIRWAIKHTCSLRKI